jgi:hypothetical protein
MAEAIVRTGSATCKRVPSRLAIALSVIACVALSVALLAPWATVRLNGLLFTTYGWQDPLDLIGTVLALVGSLRALVIWVRWGTPDRTALALTATGGFIIFLALRGTPSGHWNVGAATIVFGPKWGLLAAGVGAALGFTVSMGPRIQRPKMTKPAFHNAIRHSV